jgi:hypothetical protein
VIFNETVVLTRLGRPALAYGDPLTRAGYAFRVTPKSIIATQRYEPGRFEGALKLIEAADRAVRVRRSILPAFDDSDYSRSDLVALELPEVSVDGIDYRTECSSCGRPRIEPDFRRVGRRLRWKQGLAALNGQVPVVSGAAKAAIEAGGLSGAAFHPLDEGEHFYLWARGQLSGLIVRPEEAIGLRGQCRVCDAPLCDLFYGPLRYERKAWDGADFTYCRFRDGLVYSPRARALLQSVESLTEAEPVFLE